MDNRKKAIDIFLAGVESVMPQRLIQGNVSLKDMQLKIVDNVFNLNDIHNIFVVGFGKASASMAQALEKVMGNKITAGHIVTKYGHSSPLKYIEITEAGHPVPDENGVEGTKHILSIVKKAQKDDLVICLISGGGSALLTDIPDGCTLEDLKALNEILLKTEISITEINCIRKHLSKVKGGFLSKAAFPARVVSLILSDVVGNAIEAIASGPTAPDSTTFYDAISIISRYKIEDKIPKRLYRFLQEGNEIKGEETLKKVDKIFDRTINIIIGSNKLALEAAKEKAISLEYESYIVTDSLDNDVEDIARYIIEHVNRLRNSVNEKTCLLFAGEPTVEVRGEGLGGRNLHLTLILANLVKNIPGVTLLSGGTDGSDGPTDAAGAVVDSFTYNRAQLLGLDIEKHMENFDSYHFFKKEGGLFKTGPTQTNVMDLMILLLEGQDDCT